MDGSTPDIGLGPLSHLFRDCLSNGTQFVENTANQLHLNYDICTDYDNRLENSFAIKDLNDGYVDSFNHQMFYQDLNQQNQSISQLNVESCNHLVPNETNSGDKCFASTDLTTKLSPNVFIESV